MVDARSRRVERARQRIIEAVAGLPLEDKRAAIEAALVTLMVNAERRGEKSTASEVASKGGTARAKALTAEQRTSIGRKGAAARWGGSASRAAKPFPANEGRTTALLAAMRERPDGRAADYAAVVYGKTDRAAQNRIRSLQSSLKGRGRVERDGNRWIVKDSAHAEDRP